MKQKVKCPARSDSRQDIFQDKREEALFCRNDLEPVSVRIFYKVDSHSFIFEADTAHFSVFCKRLFIAVCLKSEVELVVTKLIWTIPVTEPC